MSTGKTVGQTAEQEQTDSSLSPQAGPGRSRRRRLAKAVPRPIIDIPDDELTPRVKTVVSTLVQEVERLKRDLERSQQRMAELASMADTDPLLGILNRRAFGRELGRAIAYAMRYGTALSVVYFDLDDFKLVNDGYGHATGDAVLRWVGETLDANVRRSDIVGRLGGDEFAVALVQTDHDRAAAKALQLVEAITRTDAQRPRDLPAISVTVGVAELAEGDNVESLLARADKAMYSDKAARKRA